ncbi:MAG: vWA domain-containing protein [Candidatus Sericytochromatia bacterium]
MNIKKTTFISAIIFSLVLSACTKSINSVNQNTDTTSTSKKVELDTKKPEAVVIGGSGSESEGKLAGGSAMAKEKLAYAPAPRASAAASSLPSSDSYSPVETTGATADIAVINKPTSPISDIAIAPQPAKRLSAGDKDDNVSFSEYLEYLSKMNSSLDKSQVIKVDVSKRFTISVIDSSEKSVSDASVTVSANGKDIFKAKTYSNGKTLFHPLAFNSDSDCQQQDCVASDKYKVTVTKDGMTSTKEFTSSEKEWNLQFEGQRKTSAQPNLDLVFLVDATGSMGDEISSIQKTIKDISSKIGSLESKPNIRYSLVSYKDRSDNYVVKRYDFTNNINLFQEVLDELSAGGGGDKPEAVNEGLSNAIDKLSWTEQDDSLKLVFLIADAGPKLGYSDDIKYPQSMNNAVKKGIKIYPIAASGLEDAGEYVFRQLAQYTMSKFLFITYSGDEQTGGTTPHQVGEFKENNLDTLVVNIVKEELANLNK